MKAKNKKLIILLAVGIFILALGSTASLVNKTSSEECVVKINYILNGADEPFDSYSAKYKVGEKICVVSPSVGGYEPRIPAYSATAKSDLKITVVYDFKAPDPVLPSSGILYKADFNTTEDWTTYFNSLDGLTLAESGNGSNAAEAKIEDNILHVTDYGRILLKDDSEIYTSDSYTITFSMLFKSFEEEEIGTLFGFEHSGNQYVKTFRLNSEGKVFRNNTLLTTLKTDTWYTFTIYVDNISLTKELFIDGVSLSVYGTTSDPSQATEAYFRFFNSTSHTEYYLDNFVIYEGAPVEK